MHTMQMLLVLFASICYEMQPTIAEEVNSLSHNISKRATKNRCGVTVNECMESNPQLVKACKVCGLINPGLPFYIISGDTVQPQHKYPWMVSLMDSGEHFCGGSIISDSFILTAAHCLDTKLPMKIQIGFLSPTSRVTSGYPIETAIIHPKYERRDGSIYYDVALLKLKKKITCDEYKNPVCLPSANARLPVKTDLTIVGWGRFSMLTTDVSKVLLEADVYVTNVKECKRTGNDLYCLRPKDVEQGTCFGDSGGPVNYERNKKYFAVGVASFVFGDCDTRRPFGYAQIASVINWITKITGVKPERFA